MTDIAKLPLEVLRRPIRVVRPRDLEAIYTRPYQETRRLAAGGQLLQLAHGYYAVPPMEWLGDPNWVPEIEPAGLAIASADHGLNGAALVGVSAARVLGFHPRALRVAIVAVPVRRRPLETVAGMVDFWARTPSELETQAWRGELGQGRVATVEQSILDVATAPRRGGISTSTAEEVLSSLALVADWEHTLELAERSGMVAAYRRARWFAEPLVPDAPRLARPRRGIVSLGLNPREPVDRDEFGVRRDR